MVTVTEIPKEMAERIVKEGASAVRLGATTPDQNTTEALFNSLLASRRIASTRIFFLEWSGDRVPSGAVVGGHEVGWTQHGIVRDAGGNHIGTYERILDAAEQKMLVFL